MNMREASAEIFGMLQDAWEDAGQDADNIFWPEIAKKPPESVPTTTGGEPYTWLRPRIYHQEADFVAWGPVGGRRFRRRGLLSCEIYTPRKAGIVLSRSLGDVVADAFTGESSPSSEVWFRDFSPQEQYSDGAWMQMNVVGKFEYDRVK